MAFWPGLAKAFLSSGFACMNLMRARLARAACGMLSRAISPLSTFRSKAWRRPSWPILNRVWCSGFFATSSLWSHPQQHVGAIDQARRPAHTFAMAAARAGFFSLLSLSIKNPPRLKHLDGDFCQGIPLQSANPNCPEDGSPGVHRRYPVCLSNLDLDHPITPDTSCEPALHV